MANGLEQIYDEALSLPAETRMLLIDKLLESLNLPIQTDIDTLWAEEAERRVSQIDNGEIELIPAEDVFKRIREKY